MEPWSLGPPCAAGGTGRIVGGENGRWYEGTNGGGATTVAGGGVDGLLGGCSSEMTMRPAPSCREEEEAEEEEEEAENVLDGVVGVQGTDVRATPLSGSNANLCSIGVAYVS